jgi:putative endonuclease
VSTTEQGRLAESAVADYLEIRGFQLLARNWRTRWHEVDIVAQNATGLHFIEVKYRQNHRYGSGFDYISRDKLQRLRRAALNWCQVNRYDGDYQIDAVSVSGPADNFMIELIENITQD